MDNVAVLHHILFTFHPQLTSFLDGLFRNKNEGANPRLFLRALFRNRPVVAFDPAAIDSASFEICLEAFDGFVGTPYVDSELDIYYLIPSEESWSDGDREVVCAVYDLSGEQLIGTAEDIRR